MITQHRMAPFYHVLICASVVVAIAGCSEGDAEGPTTLADPALRPATPRLSFAQTPSRPGEINARRASALATAWIRAFGESRNAFFVRQRGAPIDWEALKPCGQPSFIESPVQTDGASLRLVEKVSVGTFWIVAFCGVAGPEFQVAVSGLSQNIPLVRGELDLRDATANQFIPRSIPLGDPVDVGPPLADVTDQLVTKAGVVVVGTAERIIIPRWTPYSPRWLLRLTSPVRVRRRSTGETEIVTTLYFGRHANSSGNVFGVPARADKNTLKIPIRTSPGGGRDSASLLARAEFSLVTEAVDVLENK